MVDFKLNNVLLLLALALLTLFTTMYTQIKGLAKLKMAYKAVFLKQQLTLV